MGIVTGPLSIASCPDLVLKRSVGYNDDPIWAGDTVLFTLVTSEL